MKVPLNLSDHLQELFGFLGCFPSPRGTPPHYLHTSPSFLTNRSQSWELEGGPFFFSFLSGSCSTQFSPQPPIHCSSGCHGPQMLPMKPAFGLGSTESWTGAPFFFFLSWWNFPETPKWSPSMSDFLRQFLLICSRDADKQIHLWKPCSCRFSFVPHLIDQQALKCLLPGHRVIWWMETRKAEQELVGHEMGLNHPLV